jgi:hypothetical protein
MKLDKEKEKARKNKKRRKRQLLRLLRKISILNLMWTLLIGLPPSPRTTNQVGSEHCSGTVPDPS